MARRPFDPKRMAAAKAGAAGVSPPSGATRPPLTVTQLAQVIGTALAGGVPAPVRVVGEVSGARERTHWYFDLKDAGAVVNCVVFAFAARRGVPAPQNGRQVVVSGRVSFFAPGGRVSLVVDSIDPVGAGALDAALRALCDELRALGWLDPGRKRPVPTFPRRVAVVTSRTGAALQDVLDTMRRRCPAVGVLVVDTRVQGAAAGPEVAAAIARVSEEAAALGVDAVLVTRGGGSLEDLWAFNTREVAEAIVRCRVPVIAAIGHETDTTIAELVADDRAATPTQAAMRLTPDATALLEQAAALADRLAAAVRRGLRERADRLRAAEIARPLARPGTILAPHADRVGHAGQLLRAGVGLALATHRSRLDRAAAGLEHHRPAAVQSRQKAVVDQLARRLESAIRQRLRAAGAAIPAAALARAGRAELVEGPARRVASAEGQLCAVGPASVLKRGFSVTMRDGLLVRSASSVAPGDLVTTVVEDGRFDSVVEGSGPAPNRAAGPEADPPAARRPAGTARRGGVPARPASTQMDLFGRTR